MGLWEVCPVAKVQHKCHLPQDAFLDHLSICRHSWVSVTVGSKLWEAGTLFPATWPLVALGTGRSLDRW